MKDEGNVAVELIFAVTLVCLIFVPALTTLAEFADARRDVSTVANTISKIWLQTGTQPSSKSFENLVSRRLLVETRCTPNCDFLGAVVTIRVKTNVWLLQEIEISKSQAMVLNEFG